MTQLPLPIDTPAPAASIDRSNWEAIAASLGYRHVIACLLSQQGQPKAAPARDAIRFTVFGKQQPAGSKKAFAIRNKSGKILTRANGSPVIAVTDDNAKSKGWKNDVASVARSVYHGQLLRGPVKLTLVFYRPRPKGHFGKSGLNKAGSESRAPISKPDVLKLARGVEDALTGVIWADDAQIVHEVLEKRWGEPARVEVTIEPA